MNQQNRRVFRGRGGPTDRRLPKHNARRRRPPSSNSPNNNPSSPRNNKYKDDDDKLRLQNHNNDDELLTKEEEEFEVEDSVDVLSADGDDGNASVEGGDDDEEVSKNNNDERDEQQIQHLMKRIRNNRETMQNSKSLVVPSNYRRLVLDAVKNTVNEWGAIAEQSKLTDHTDTTTSTNTGRAVFELVQQALQCGPLAGSKPGYMKRCGTEVATMVYDFLNAISTTVDSSNNDSSVANPDGGHGDDGTDGIDYDDHDNIDTDDGVVKRLMETYCWTYKQASAIETWKDNAKKAIEKGKPVSKSILKKQQQVVSANNNNNSKKK